MPLADSAALKTLRLIASVLQMMSSVLAGTPDVDPPGQVGRRSTGCGFLRPIQAFMAIRGTTVRTGTTVSEVPSCAGEGPLLVNTDHRVRGR
jgi:hypothetical protein